MEIAESYLDQSTGVLKDSNYSEVCKLIKDTLGKDRTAGAVKNKLKALKKVRQDRNQERAPVPQPWSKEEEIRLATRYAEVQVGEDQGYSTRFS